MKRIGEEPTMPNHGPEADFFNQLLLDLKKQLLGHSHAPVTMERLEEGTKHVFTLDKCRHEMRRR